MVFRVDHTQARCFCSWARMRTSQQPAWGWAGGTPALPEADRQEPGRWRWPDLGSEPASSTHLWYDMGQDTCSHPLKSPACEVAVRILTPPQRCTAGRTALKTSPRAWHGRSRKARPAPLPAPRKGTWELPSKAFASAAHLLLWRRQRFWLLCSLWLFVSLRIFLGLVFLLFPSRSFLFQHIFSLSGCQMGFKRIMSSLEAGREQKRWRHW